jgi:quinol-cytochrome oxidoreductase complex cytochrome b subunit
MVKEKVKKSKQEIEDPLGLRDVLNWHLLVGSLFGSLDERLNIREGLEKALKKPVPSHVNWLFCLGGISFFLFMVTVVTGVLLMFYYYPTTDEAYDSVVNITNNVPFGWLVRGLHYWAANLMVITVLLHTLRVYFYGAYKYPRDFNWVIGVFLLILTLLFCFTGYLLPWNQVSYWATVIGTESAGAVPFVGKYLKFFLRAGPEISHLTLIRFYTAHVVVLPAVTIFFLALHFAMIRKQGISEPL